MIHINILLFNIFFKYSFWKISCPTLGVADFLQELFTLSHSSFFYKFYSV